MTGRYPPGHGARHNGMRVDLDVRRRWPTRWRGRASRPARSSPPFRSIAASGLINGFETYGDRMPRGAQRAPGQRAARARQVVDEAIAWLDRAPQRATSSCGCTSSSRTRRTAIAATARPVARALRRRDRGGGPAGGPAHRRRSGRRGVVRRWSSLAADHGEAFGEHGEIGHSLFVYDTTLRVPLVIAGRASGRRVISDAGRPGGRGADGVARCSACAARSTLTASISRRRWLGASRRERDLYAETFAPLLDFGWSPLRAMRSGGFKYIAAPKPELFQVASDPARRATSRLRIAPARRDSANVSTASRSRRCRKPQSIGRPRPDSTPWATPREGARRPTHRVRIPRTSARWRCASRR